MKKIIMGIELGQRREEAQEVQKLLTEYGCFIKTRLGLHETGNQGNACSETGLILLEFVPGQEEEAVELKNKLEGLKDIKVNTMEF